MKVADLISRIRQLLQDESGYRWDDPTLLNCYNEALLWVVQQRPDANSQVVDKTCEKKSQQTKPDGAYRLLSVLSNVDTGRTIEPISRDDMNALNPNWSNEVWTGYVELYLTDERTPDVFWIYPPPNVDHVIDCQISREPTWVTDPDTTDVEIPMIHYNPLKNSAMAFAYLTDGDTEGNLMQAQNYLKMAANDLQIKWSIDLLYSRPIQGDTGEGNG